MRGRVIAYFLYSQWRPSTILNFHIFAIFVKKIKFAPLFRRRAEFSKDRTIRGRVITYFLFFYFQSGGRPPSWIWYDVIADDPRLVFDGTNILLKLHVDRVYVLRDIAILPARRGLCYNNLSLCPSSRPSVSHTPVLCLSG